MDLYNRRDNIGDLLTLVLPLAGGSKLQGKRRVCYSSSRLML